MLQFYFSINLFKTLKKMKKLLSFISFFLLFNFSQAQTGAVRGFVYEKESGEPVIFTSVYLKGTSYGVATNVDGYYLISKVPAGDYTLTITYIGYDTLQVPITITANKILDKKLYLTSTSIKLEEFTVSAERQEMQKAIHASVTKVTPKQIKKLPSMGAEPDLAQYLQIVPGVVFTGDQGGQLYIRGGSPIQNKVLLDGMLIYNPFHSIGLFSVFDSDIIRNADIFTGGFNAQYGGRISSVMDIKTRDGNKKRVSGKISGDTFGGKLLVEGPIIKQKEDDGLSLSYVFSGKTSYLSETSKTLYSYANEDGLPFGFSDYFGKLSLNGENGSKLNLFGFSFNDYVKDYQELSDFNWNSYGIGSNIVMVPSGFSALITANIAYSNYEIEMKTKNQAPKTSSIGGFNVGLGFTYFLGDDQFDYGLEILGYNTNYTYTNTLGQINPISENTSELAFFGLYKKNFGKLIIEPGLRIQYYASLSESNIEPRLGLKYKITDRFRIKAAGGMYSQNIIAANSSKDVVNLFYGFLTTTSPPQEEYEGKEVTSSLQKSNHFIFGVESDINNRITLNVEGYFKKNTQMTEINRNKIFDDDASNATAPEILTSDFSLEKGDAYGVDFLLKYDYRRLYLWAVYSLGFVTREGEFLEDDGVVYVREYAPHFDRRHNVNFMLSYTFGKDFNWETGVRWNFGSGFPFTQTKGNYEYIPFLDGVNSDYTSANGELGIMLSDINEGRLPSYHRLDFNIKRTFYLSDNAKLQITGSVTNVYNKENFFYIERGSNKEVYQLPILPSIGMSLSF